ncbi:MAG TPA: hypothetical protein VFX25_25805 [Streptosporangiaceae bacterium]|nr:hypothetical protein [Streptosporangiaceae bacterium]
MKPGRAAGTGAPARAAASSGDPARPDAAGLLLSRLTVLPALIAVAWLAGGLPLLLLGWFTPVLMLVVCGPLAAAAAYAGWRWVPGLRGGGPGPAGTPWWTVVALIAVAVAFGADQLAFHSQQIIVERDPASYIQFGNWIAGHHSLPIPMRGNAFGPARQLLRFDSSAFYQAQGAVVPQFMAGLPMILAAGFWAGGVSGAVLVTPLLGALGVLTFGGLVARLAGPRWAPLAALALALSLPEQFTSRSAYSEPAAQILFLGGLCLIIDALVLAGRAGGAGRAGAEGRAGRAVTALGGLALGLTVLVRIDGVSDILPVIPYVGLLLAGRRPQALPLLAGTAAGAAYGLVNAVVLSRPYVDSISGSLLPLAGVAAVALAATAAGVVVLRRRRLPDLRGTRLPGAAAALVVVIMTGFAVRPYVQTVHGQATPLATRVMAGYQRLDHLPVDPTRLYYEISLHWVFWYIGLPAVVLGTLGAALLARRCLRGEAPAWTLPLLAFGWIIVVTLARPGITPDQPWASRRLVPAVLPGFLLLAAWAGAWLLDWLRRTGREPLIRRSAAVLAAAALLLPAAVTTFGLSFSGVNGLATKTTYSGEIAAVDRLCASIPADASVVVVNYATASRFVQLIRGMCGVPAARLFLPEPASVQATVAGIRRAGRRPVLLAAKQGQLTRFGGPARQIMALHSTTDAHPLTGPPTGASPFALTVWMSEPAS